MSKSPTIHEAPVQLTIAQIRAYQDWLVEPHDYETVAREFPTLEEWAAKNPYPFETLDTELQLTWKQEFAALGWFVVGLIGFALMFVGAWHVVHGWLGWF